MFFYLIFQFPSGRIIHLCTPVSPSRSQGSLRYATGLSVRTALGGIAEIEVLSQARGNLCLDFKLV